ncbi:MAG: iron-containing alcohol dehydrogenase, partial [Sporomusa sp.]
MFIANTYTPTRVFFGVGVFEDLATIELPGKKALICTGPSIKKMGILDRAISLLNKNQVETVVYDKITPNPLKCSVMEAAALGREQGCD